MLEHCNIPTPPFAIVRNEEMALDPAPGQKAIELSPHATALSSYPLFVKPNAEGDSKGVVPASKVSNQDELESAIRVLREKFPQQDILIETFLPGQEFSVGILGTGREARVIGLASYNFRPLNDQNSPRQIDFHLQGKDNLESGAVEQVVMHMDHPGVREVGEMGIRAWNVLGCRDGGRVDIRLDAESKPQVLEVRATARALLYKTHSNMAILQVNPIPGLSMSSSIYPAIARGNGIPFPQLLESIVNSALKRKENTVHANH
ncbi:hypothetical protein IFM58399_08420 [Aspergillus lentulus]|uniref:ATP-grasp domain-containing protein n=1 Tax=Aspergillus lentulus TaxID=293939 RepID=A0ABQ0ZUF4_ASPLE|nr:uncharacterized protein IFM58399_08420 [Aspergillus lentulus]GFF48899.1 hypothetical protein IFM58399_08420 [Aspergillus lentulus]GFF64955.1 hypothetical protein IFM60648_01445 [Aspergillus lentulus]